MNDVKQFGILILVIAAVGAGYYFMPQGEVDMSEYSPTSAEAANILVDINTLRDASWDKAAYAGIENNIKISKAMYDGEAGLSPSTANDLLDRLNSAYITVLRAETKKVYRNAREITDIYAVNEELYRYDRNGEYSSYEVQTDDLRTASLDMQRLLGYPVSSKWYGKSLNYKINKYLTESPYDESKRDDLLEKMEKYQQKDYLSSSSMVTTYISNMKQKMDDHASMDGLIALAKSADDCKDFKLNNHYYSRCLTQVNKKNNE